MARFAEIGHINLQGRTAGELSQRPLPGRDFEKIFLLRVEVRLAVAAQGKPKVIPVDDFVRDELYPGYTQAFGTQPFVAGPVRPFSRADNASYWLRDSLHFSEGMVPASIALLDDAQTWGAQLGAEIVGVPPTRGSVNRLAGTHVYIGTIDVDTDWQIQARAARFGQYVGPVLQDFDRYWAMRAAELQSGYDHFDGLDLAGMDPGQLWTAVKDAYAFHRRAWFIHFEVMYVLTANYLAPDSTAPSSASVTARMYCTTSGSAGRAGMPPGRCSTGAGPACHCTPATSR